MSMTGQVLAGADDIADETRRAWRDASLVPLWESPTAHKLDAGPAPAQHWSWSVVRPLIMEALKARSPAAVERRVLSLVNPSNLSAADESTVGNISAALQILSPGETARPHRHSMNALRFVLDGEGAYTIVDNKRCLMREGDMVLTPAWCWHAHVHEGDGPIVWLDVLDVPLHNRIGTAAFQPGPINDEPRQTPDAAFAVANIVPDGLAVAADYSPVFRYSRADAVRALGAAPTARDGTRRVRYANPLTGGPSMSFLDSCLVGVDAAESVPVRTSANTVFCVADGAGESRIGESTIRWQANDVFTVPQDNWSTHRADGKGATLLEVSDREIYRRLGLLREETAA